MAQCEVNETVRVLGMGPRLAEERATALVKSEAVELIRLVLRAGQATKVHHAAGPVIAHCLTGMVEFTLENDQRHLAANELVIVPAGLPHSVHAIEDSAMLLTVITAGTSCDENDMVREASEESFPASDPPARSLITGP